MSRSSVCISAVVVALLVRAAPAAEAFPPCPPGTSDFVPIFDGKTLHGWHVSGKTGHGTGGAWTVVDGAIHGTQDKPGNGGIILTDARYGDFEVSLEMGNDFGPDSGLFLRGTEDGKAYQALIDFYAGGTVMGIYGEGLGGFSVRNYRFGDKPGQIEARDCPTFQCPFTPAQWKQLWQPNWNTLRARITGNPPTITTWINGVTTMHWTDTEKRLPDTGGIALQVHGGGDLTKQRVRYRNIRVRRLDTPDNTLSPEEKAAGWKLLFDGKTLDGWKTNKMTDSQTPVEDGCLNPHQCGGYMLVYEKPQGDFVLALDFKITKGCNSGIFVRTDPLHALPGQSVGYNGLEMQILDGGGTSRHDAGAIYDLVAPCRNAMKPVGQWNHAVIVCDGPKVICELNGERVTTMNLDEWTEKGKRPDGSSHKFERTAWKDHPREGYIGLQDHGSPVWFKNIKLLPIDSGR